MVSQNIDSDSNGDEHQVRFDSDSRLNQDTYQVSQDIYSHLNEDEHTGSQDSDSHPIANTQWPGTLSVIQIWTNT